MKDRAYKVAGNCKHDGCQRVLVWFINFLVRKKGSGMSVNEKLAEELHKLVIKNFKRRKVYARFKGSIWAADLAEMGSFSFKNKDVKYLLCVIDIFAKYVFKRFKPLKL